MLETTASTINQGFEDTCEYHQIVGTFRAAGLSRTTAMTADCV
jgi:hypothetical protein